MILVRLEFLRSVGLKSTLVPYFNGYGKPMEILQTAECILGVICCR